jgi:hypothetical protein
MTKKKFMFYIHFIFAFFVCIHTIAQTPASAQNKSILILGATIHAGNGNKIENGAIGFERGKITLIGNATQRNIIKEQWNEIINAEGKHLYPGLIAPYVVLGLTEIDAVNASIDYNEVGEYNPNVRSLIAYNAESRIIPTVRYNGVLLTQSTPKGALISGKSSVFKLDGWNWEDACVKADDGVYLNWPPNYSYAPNEEGKWLFDKNKNHDKQVNELDLFFEKCIAYNRSKTKTENDVRMEGLKGIINGSENLYIVANAVKDINEAIAFAKSKNIPKIVLVGGEEAGFCIDILKQYNIPVILNRVHSLPPKTDDDIYFYYKLPALLAANNILFCLSYEGDMEAMGSRNLAFIAGTAASYGLTKEQALQAVSLNTAKILGIDNLYGSLEEGKSATLFISEGDALEMKTNKLSKAFINGAEIELKTHQTELYDKYLKKYGLKP